MTSLSLIVLRTANPEALLPFYQALGLEFKSEQHGNGPIHFSCETGGVVLEIYPPKKDALSLDFSAPMLGFAVDSSEEALENLRYLGAEPGEIKASEWGRVCSVLDFDGRSVQLMER